VTFSCKYSGAPDDSAAFKDNTQFFAVYDASNTSPIKITVDPKLKLTLKDNDKVIVEAIEGNADANGTFLVRNVGRSSFELFKLDGTPTKGVTAAKPKTGRWGTLPYHAALDTSKELTKVFNRVTGDDSDGTFLGTFVKVNGVDRNPKTGIRFRVWQRGKRDIGQLLLNIPLTDALGNELQPGPYDVTFFGDVNNQ